MKTSNDALSVHHDLQEEQGADKDAEDSREQCSSSIVPPDQRREGGWGAVEREIKNRSRGGATRGWGHSEEAQGWGNEGVWERKGTQRVGQIVVFYRSGVWERKGTQRVGQIVVFCCGHAWLET